MEEKTKKAIESLSPSKASQSIRSPLVNEVLRGVVSPVLGGMAKELCGRGVEACIETEEGHVALLITQDCSNVSELSFRVVSDKAEIRVCGVFRGVVEAESIDSILVEEHVRAFLAHVFQ